MSQVEVAKPSRLAKPKARAEALLKTFEWNWTKAIVFSLGLTFFILITTSVLPSFWMYFAEQKLGWGGPTDVEGFLKEPLGQEGLLQVRDAIAMGIATVPIIVILVVASVMQNWRRKLRGQSGDVRPTGGYR